MPRAVIVNYEVSRVPHYINTARFTNEVFTSTKYRPLEVTLNPNTSQTFDFERLTKNQEIEAVLFSCGISHHPSDDLIRQVEATGIPVFYQNGAMVRKAHSSSGKLRNGKEGQVSRCGDYRTYFAPDGLDDRIFDGLECGFDGQRVKGFKFHEDHELHVVNPGNGMDPLLFDPWGNVIVARSADKGKIVYSTMVDTAYNLNSGESSGVVLLRNFLAMAREKYEAKQKRFKLSHVAASIL